MYACEYQSQIENQNADPDVLARRRTRAINCCTAPRTTPRRPIFSSSATSSVGCPTKGRRKKKPHSLKLRSSARTCGCATNTRINKKKIVKEHDDDASDDKKQTEIDQIPEENEQPEKGNIEKEQYKKRRRRKEAAAEPARRSQNPSCSHECCLAVPSVAGRQGWPWPASISNWKISFKNFTCKRIFL